MAKKSILKKYEEARLVLAELLDADYLTVQYQDALPKFYKLMDKVQKIVEQG